MITCMLSNQTPSIRRRLGYLIASGGEKRLRFLLQEVRAFFPENLAAAGMKLPGCLLGCFWWGAIIVLLLLFVFG